MSVYWQHPLPIPTHSADSNSILCCQSLEKPNVCTLDFQMAYKSTHLAEKTCLKPTGNQIHLVH